MCVTEWEQRELEHGQYSRGDILKLSTVVKAFFSSRCRHVFHQYNCKWVTLILLWMWYTYTCKKINIHVSCRLIIFSCFLVTTFLKSSKKKKDLKRSWDKVYVDCQANNFYVCFLQVFACTAEVKRACSCLLHIHSTSDEQCIRFSHFCGPWWSWIPRYLSGWIGTWGRVKWWQTGCQCWLSSNVKWQEN